MQIGLERDDLDSPDQLERVPCTFNTRSGASCLPEVMQVEGRTGVGWPRSVFLPLQASTSICFLDPPGPRHQVPETTEPCPLREWLIRSRRAGAQMPIPSEQVWIHARLPASHMNQSKFLGVRKLKL